jgi:hypothetical protein
VPNYHGRCFPGLPSLSWRRSLEATTKSKSSCEEPRSVPLVSDEQQPEPETQTEAEPAISKSTIVSLTMLDEAFVDFWHDALLDPIASSFPSFVICKLSDARRAIHARGSTLTGLNVLTDAGKPVFILFHHHHHPCRTPPRLRSKSKAATLLM